MLFLSSHHIVDLYCWVDDHVPAPSRPKGGRPSCLSDSELITILIWHTLVAQQKTLKDLHGHMCLYHMKEFPKLPKYNAFLDHCHRVTPRCLTLLMSLMRTSASVRIMDATMLPVCRLHRANDHKTAQGLARFGKNHQGWHYGFKLHASIDLSGVLCGLVLTPANVHDARMMYCLCDGNTRLAVGDTLYGARIMCTRMWEHYGTVIIAPPHPKQTKKVAAPWQIDLLNLRPKIESVFDVLKEHLHLVTSFARSVTGYLVHYVRILLSYQIMALSLAK